MKELIEWLTANKIVYKTIDKEVIEIAGFGKMFLADLSGVQSIFRGKKDKLQFNLMENPQILREEGINYVAFPFGQNWYYYDLREEFKMHILKYIGQRMAPAHNVPFANLGVHTGYELLNGSGDLSLWVKKAKLLGQQAIGICDHNTMAATLNLQKECAKQGIKHVFGYSFVMEHEGCKVDMKLYCQSQKGLRNLLRIQKAIMVDSESNTISLSELLKYAKGNVLVIGKHHAVWIDKSRNEINVLKNAFNKVFYQVDLTEYKAERIDVKALFATGYFFDNLYNSHKDTFLVEPVLICDNYYLDKDDARNKVILNKIASGAAHEQSDEQYFKDIDQHFEVIQAIFDPNEWNIKALFERMCANTVKIAEGAVAKYEQGEMYMPQYIMTEEEVTLYEDRRKLFHALLEQGLVNKIPAHEHELYRNRLEEEVYVIESTNNVDYFLIQWDMVREAKRRGIATGVGRGSAGGSLVSYLLGIISIDPIKYDLIFSRFLVPERCGLNWEPQVSILGQDLYVPARDYVVNVTLGGKQIKFHREAKLCIDRNQGPIIVTAEDLLPGDVIRFDNRDIIWTITELLK